MSVELVIAPPASGKTYQCIRRLQDALRQTSPGYARVVLPDRTQVQFFRLRLAQAGGALGAEIGTFGGLFNEILSRAGIDIPVTPDPMQIRLVRSAVETLHENGELIHYATLWQMTGFTLLVRDRIAELKRSLVSPEDF